MNNYIYQIEISGGEYEDKFSYTHAICNTYDKAKEIADCVKNELEQGDTDDRVWLDDVYLIDVRVFTLNRRGYGKTVYRWRRCGKGLNAVWENESKK